MTKHVVLITGATGGVGKALSNCFAKKGYMVAIGYHSNRQQAESLANELNANGYQTLAVNVDYRSRHTIQQSLLAIENYFGSKVSILINNGAIAQEKPFATITDNDWQTMLDINLQGPFRATQEVLPFMQQRHWGRIINITSIGGQWGGFNQVHYAASKAALINFTQSIAKIYSVDGIASMAVAIGLVSTDMSANELATEAGKEKVRNIPARRLATAEEIAIQVENLCQDDAFYLTGQTLNMNGGMYFG